MEVHLLHFPTLDSTNGWAKSHFGELASPNVVTVITTDVQTHGKGRYGRQWVSKPGNLALSLAFTLAGDSPLLPHLAQLLSLVLWEWLYEEGIEAKIKWPNDLLVKGKKLAGILVETFSYQDRIGVVAGIGMNVNAPIELYPESVSLVELLAKQTDLSLLRKQLVHRFLASLERFENDGFAPMRKTLEANLAYRGERVCCQVGEDLFVGTLEGLSTQGALILKTKENRTIHLTSGQITHLRQSG